MQLKPPADELAEIRAEIARLRAREGALREILLRDAAMPKIGRFHTVDLVTSRQRIFDPRLLPEEIRLDPAYTREKVTRVLRATRKGPAQAADSADPPAPDPRAALRARLFAGQQPH
ncbi:hypothetical protein [Rhodobacter capsulatus]|jgi:hypothetical protein|uniref:Uncharacterized protein n=1 Tax=Rhodobacter capsulatus (strain ATCC BAA-309 / NBRC 16581 / SB1003) TaxID=272942 RepID=D5AS87_RHOCB|nr:hypothetical protein [Rhodobacter capsulatus]ADE84978.1 conserved hypothetical protein [Rhodobacter capsulatus SB 1003]ETD02413.1 hypothetical protein U714_07340 [Rhodobacter capsulatus DE442]ETD77705.1 hypothetical protein U717_07520 [Rhodobacter capsulatus R121]ETD86784.1 hypothetical protein U716_01740 [Rhodobacter capsulatus B6]ETE54355.1 hypothetical protein U715_07510 [Rhodobacter capsulatus Y262]